MSREKRYKNYYEAEAFARRKGGTIYSQIFEGCAMVYIVTYLEAGPYPWLNQTASI